MIKTPEAKQLCTATELDLFSASLSRPVKKLDEKQLKKSVKRVRRARDKYQTLANQQIREARGKREPRGRKPSRSAQRTVRKVELFAQTLERYEKRLSDVEAAAAKKPAAAKTAVARKKAPAKKVSKNPTVKKVARKKVSPPKAVAKKKKATVKGKTKSGTLNRQRSATSGLVRKRKHLSAQAKRRQSKRDSG